MRKTFRRSQSALCGLVILLFLIFASAQSGRTVTGEPALGQPVRVLLDAQLAQVSDLRCHKSVQRFIRGLGKFRQVDRIDLDVEMHSGHEKYTRIQRNGEEYLSIEDLPGSWSSGELASVIQVTRNAMAAERLAFSVPISERQWSLLVGGTRYWMAIQGIVRLTGSQVASIEWTGTGLPPKSTIRKIVLTIVFTDCPIGGKVFRVPASSEFRVDYLDALAGAALDQSVYSNYRRLGSTARISF